MSKRSRRRVRGNPAANAIAPSPGQQADGDSASAGMIVASAATFSGPLPPPIILEQYDDVLEGAAERIFKMAEEQAKHRQELEKSVVKSDILKSYLGLGAGFLVATVAIVGGSIVAYNGQAWAGAAIGGAPVAALVWAFLKGTNDRRSEREAKANQLQHGRRS